MIQSHEQVILEALKTACEQAERFGAYPDVVLKKSLLNLKNLEGMTGLRLYEVTTALAGLVRKDRVVGTDRGEYGLVKTFEWVARYNAHEAIRCAIVERGCCATVDELAADSNVVKAGWNKQELSSYVTSQFQPMAFVRLDGNMEQGFYPVNFENWDREELGPNQPDERMFHEIHAAVRFSECDAGFDALRLILLRDSYRTDGISSRIAYNVMRPTEQARVRKEIFDETIAYMINTGVIKWAAYEISPNQGLILRAFLGDDSRPNHPVFMYVAKDGKKLPDMVAERRASDSKGMGR
ncbi:MAG: hypothetical protein WAZ18_02115 [Alphaproteobacteria bacterium]